MNRECLDSIELVLVGIQLGVAGAGDESMVAAGAAEGEAKAAGRGETGDGGGFWGGTAAAGTEDGGGEGAAIELNDGGECHEKRVAGGELERRHG